MKVLTMKKILHLIMFLNLLKHCVSRNRKRIAGGHTIHKGQFPYFVQIIVGSEDSEGHITFSDCGGSLIHAQWVLTAAYCFKKFHMVSPQMFEEGWIRAYVGTNKRAVGGIFDDPGLIHEAIIKVHIHSGYTYRIINYYSEYVTNDVALAYLAKKFSLNEFVKLVRLPDFRTELCSEGTVIGGGIIGFNYEKTNTLKYAYVYSKTLNKISLKPSVVRPNVYYSETKWLKGHSVLGDTGGPYICYDNLGAIQYGIISNYYNNTEEQTAITQYEPVEKHMRFITQYVNIGVNYKGFRTKSKPQTKTVQATSTAVWEKLSSTVLCIKVIVDVVIMF